MAIRDMTTENDLVMLRLIKWMHYNTKESQSGNSFADAVMKRMDATAEPTDSVQSVLRDMMFEPEYYDNAGKLLTDIVEDMKATEGKSHKERQDYVQKKVDEISKSITHQRAGMPDAGGHLNTIHDWMFRHKVQAHGNDLLRRIGKNSTTGGWAPPKLKGKKHETKKPV